MQDEVTTCGLIIVPLKVWKRINIWEQNKTNQYSLHENVRAD
jgi:hypothetical protein